MIPYSSAIQGNGLDIKITDDIYILNTADRVVVVGGTYSGWTLAIIEYVKKIGKEFIYLELAYIGDTAANLAWHRPSKAIVSSDYSKSVLSEAWDPATIYVGGSPQLDFVPEFKPVYTLEKANKVLIYTSVCSPDSMEALKSVFESLLQSNYEVVVRLHPRESFYGSYWDKSGAVLQDRSQTLSEALSDSRYAIGVLGTFNSVLAASGVPTAVVMESSNRGAPTEFLPYLHIWNKEESIDLNLSAIDKIANSGKDCTPVVGPIGGSAKRIIREILR